MWCNGDSRHICTNTERTSRKEELYSHERYLLVGEFSVPEGEIYCKYSRPDVDNLLKRSYLDAMTGIVWKDDGCVWSACCRKWYREKHGVGPMEWRGGCRG